VDTFVLQAKKVLHRNFHIVKRNAVLQVSTDSPVATRFASNWFTYYAVPAAAEYAVLIGVVESPSPLSINRTDRPLSVTNQSISLLCRAPSLGIGCDGIDLPVFTPVTKY
jgi:hypothetical protein